ncbi:hypothetical protein H9P43_008520 [Blastocladiella emersonii ATCC 22665]|nr:hypothetical protein H9P43_008520 [Blastocladiella emersonii ATCC 22665]
MISSLQATLQRTFTRSSNDSTHSHHSGSMASEPRPSLFHSSVPAALAALPSDVPRMNLIQYADLARAARDLRTAVQMVATTAETMHRVLASLRGCRSSARELLPAEEGDLQFLAALVASLARAHTALGDRLYRELETPLLADIEAIHADAVAAQRQNEAKLDQLARQLKDAEATAQKTRKAKHRDLMAYQQSLTLLNGIAMEIKRVEAANMVVGDDLAERRLPHLLERCHLAARATAATYLDIGSAVRAVARAFPHASLAATFALAAAPDAASLAVPPVPPLPAEYVAGQGPMASYGPIVRPPSRTVSATSSSTPAPASE